MAEVGPEDQERKDGRLADPQAPAMPQPEAQGKQERGQAEAEVVEAHVEQEVVDEREAEEGKEPGPGP
jgi:hypothetical protein